MMIKRERTYGFIIITLLTLILSSARNAGAQNPKSAVTSFPDLFQLLADQPDHVDDRTLVIEGNLLRVKYAKKQDRMRQEFYLVDLMGSLKSESSLNYRLIMIGKLNQRTMVIDPQEKTYAEAPEEAQWASPDLAVFLKKTSTELGKIKAENAGTTVIDGHPASKIRVRFEGSTGEMDFYFANDLKNLCLKMEAGTIKQVKEVFTAANISFDVPDDLFEIPKDYKRVDVDSLFSTIKQKVLK